MPENRLINQNEVRQLPLELGDGLLLRWGVPDDAKSLGEFNVRVHSDNVGQPDGWLVDWTADLMNGQHPTTKANDFTIVTDQNAGSKVVSSLNIISQTWTYDGIPFGVGRIELVGTDPQYRRRGLIRAQMAAVHAKSAARGELVQAITGIPWYYRQFEYEMTINLGGSRELFWIRPGNDKPLEEEIYKMRPAERSDISTLEELYPRHSADSLIVHQRDKEIWAYEMFVAAHETPGARTVHVIEDNSGMVVAYAQIKPRGSAFRVREVGSKEGHSWQAVAHFIVRELKKRADKLNLDREKPLTHISFNLGEKHPIYEVLGSQLEKFQKPYAWYIRVPDLLAILRLIKPVLERRLRESVMAGYSGNLRINLYRSAIILKFDAGKLSTIDTYKPTGYFDSDVFFPDLTFYHMVFCHRNFAEVDASRADCFAEHPHTVILLDCLFPKRPSDINPLN